MRERIFTSEQGSSIRADYDSGMSLYQCMAKWGGSRSAIAGAIKRDGGRMRTFKEANRDNVLALSKKQRLFSDEAEQSIGKEYSRGEKADQLATKYDCDITTIYKVLAKLDVEKRYDNRQYTLNEHAFDDVSKSEIGTYLVGLLMADGCVVERKRPNGGIEWSVRLALSGGDGHHVDTLREFVGSNAPIYVRPRSVVATPNGDVMASERFEFAARSEKLARALMSYGVVPNKSGRERPLRGIGESLWFFRGMVDGDGWCSVRKYPGRTPTASLGLVGSKDMLDCFAKIVKNITPTKTKPAPMGSIWRFAITGAHAYRVARALYDDAKIALPRKLAAARSIMSECYRFESYSGMQDWSWITKDVLVEARRTYGSWAKVAKSLGVPIGSIYSVAKRHALTGHLH